MTRNKEIVIGGVDTHKDTHWASAITTTGQRIADKQFPASLKGYKDILSWLSEFGEVSRIGIECTGSYGAGLCRYLQGKDIVVMEISAPDKQLRRLNGKDDAEDAYQAAAAALAHIRSNIAKDRASDIEGLRCLRVAYEGAVKARTAALNSLGALIINADEGIRMSLNGQKGIARARVCAAWRTSSADRITKHIMDKTAIRSIAKRILELDKEAHALDCVIKAICEGLLAQCMKRKGVGHHSASKLLLAAGANIDRMDSEAHFSMLCGASPIKASSGNKTRMRLSHGGDRQANSALYTIALSRMATDQRSKEFIAKKMTEGKSKREAMRCLKRYIAREIYGCLKADLRALGFDTVPVLQL